MAAPVDIVLYNANAQTITVAVSVNPTTPVNDAAVNARLVSAAGTEVFNSDCPYTPASDGLYTLDIDDTFQQPTRSGYFLYFSIISPTTRNSHIRKRVSVRDRN